LNGLTLVALIALAIGIAAAYRAGGVNARRRAQRTERSRVPATPPVTGTLPPTHVPADRDIAAPSVARA
jgi:hypothetical protein